MTEVKKQKKPAIRVADVFLSIITGRIQPEDFRPLSPSTRRRVCEQLSELVASGKAQEADLAGFLSLASLRPAKGTAAKRRASGTRVSSLGVIIIPKALAAAHGFGPGTPVTLSVEGGALQVRKAELQVAA